MTPVPAPSDGFPLSVSFDEALDLEQIRVGEQGIRPRSHRISFHSKDRHAYALADVVGSDAPDLFVSRGGERWQTAWVGQREDSRFSQTHHRVYFGLGAALRADEIRVDFADGQRIVERDVAAGQRILLRHPQAGTR